MISKVLQKRNYLPNLFALLLLLMLQGLSSCSAYKDLLLFRKEGAPLPDMAALEGYKTMELTMQSDDVISITVSSFDPLLAAPFNLIDSRSTATVQANSPLVGFVVDKKGEIDYPILGKILVAGKTMSQVKADISERLKPYLKDATVNARRLNFRISVLGEVAKPGTFSLNSERVTIFEALGMAGDLTPYSDRQHILVVREENGVMTYGKVDLQSIEVFKSAYYYLHQNDMLYVDPLKNRRATVVDESSKYLPFVTTALSLVSTILTFILLSR